MEDDKKYSIVKSLLNGDIPFNELINAYGIHVSIANLETCIYGFTYVSSNNNFYVILNGKISFEIQRKVFLHELKHILYDCPKQSYYLGLNMQNKIIEIDADKFANNAEKQIKKAG